MIFERQLIFISVFNVNILPAIFTHVSLLLLFFRSFAQGFGLIINIILNFLLFLLTPIILNLFLNLVDLVWEQLCKIIKKSVLMLI